jgi:hypothetical protein
MEKTSHEHNLKFHKLKNNKNELNYSLIREINGNFDWVNQLFLETSQTVIDLDKDPKLLKKEEVDVLKKLLNAMSDEQRDGSPYTNITKNSKTINPSNSENGEKKVMKNKTGNTRKKCKLGHLVDYEIENSKFLTKNFKLDKNEKVVAYLYSIDVYKKKKYYGESETDKRENIYTDIEQYEKNEFSYQEKLLSNKKSYGILFSYPFSDYFQFPILKPISTREKKFNVEYVKIEFVEKLILTKETFVKLIQFHHNFFSDMYTYKE